MEQAIPVTKRYKVFFVFSGEGGGALGAKNALPAILGDDSAVCEVIGGIDVDPLACQDFEMWTGVKATCLDLFDRDQYRKFHGKEPPADWREATPDDLRRAAGGQVPDIVIITAPCKGFSGLLGKDKAQTDKYKALNRLAERGLFLVLATWKPAFLGFENVKGIQTRGAVFLSKIEQLLQAYKYLWYPNHYDCGVWGGLAQHRMRYMAFARDPEQVPCFLYNPPKNRVRAIEEVIGDMPMPIDPDNPPSDLDAAGGPMNMSPRLQWKTWVRLALIPPGGDWRDLQNIKPGEYSIVPDPQRPKHFNIVKTAEINGAGAPVEGDVSMPGFSEDRTHHVKYLVQEMDRPANTVTGQKDIQTGAPVIADTRGPSDGQQHANKYRVEDAAGAAHTVTGNDRLGSGAPAVADPRHPNWFDTSHRVTPIDEPAPTVTGQGSPSGAAVVIADPNPLGHTPMGGGRGAFWVQDSGDASGTITGDPRPGKSGGASVIADHRLGHEPRDASMRVGDVTEPSGPIIGSAAVTSSNGIGAVADPRYTREPRSGVYAVMDTAGPSKTIVGGKDPNGNMLSVADPGRGDRFNNVQAVTDMSAPAKAVTAASGASNAAPIVSDPAPELYGNMLRMNDVTEPGNTVTGAAGPNQGANLIADPRPTWKARGNTKGPLGVQEWDQPAATVTGTGDAYTGATAVSDPRPVVNGTQVPAWDCRIPGEEERGVWYITSPHTDKRGRHCWHRPMTTLELLAIQGFPIRHADGRAVVLSGKSDRTWREHIGNAWPPPAAGAVIRNMLMSLLASETVGFLWDVQQTGVLVLPPVGEEEHEVA